MKHMRRAMLLVMVVVIVMGNLGLSSRGVEEKPGKVEVPVVFVRSGIEADSIRAVAESYTKKTGIPVEIMEAGRTGFYPAVHTQLLGKTTEFDLAQANDVDVAVLAHAGVIEPIDKYLNDPKLTNLDEYDLDDLAFTYQYEGQTYAVPFDVSTHFMYYRSDLIPNPPETWDEYLQLARKFSKSQNPNSPTTYGAGFTALAGSEQPKMFYTMMWSYGGWTVDDAGNVGVDSAGALKAANLLRAFVQERLVAPDIYSWGFSEVMEALQTGLAAMASPYWNAAYTTIKESSGVPSQNIKLALVPGVRQADGSIYRTPFQQGKILLMNANSPRKEAAYKFLEYLTGKEGMKIMTEAGGTPSRFSILGDPEMTPPEYYQMMLESLKIAKGDPGPVFYPEQHEAMNQALTDIITGVQRPEEALKRAANTIRGLWEQSK